jgi:hypothetical protein
METAVTAFGLLMVVEQYAEIDEYAFYAGILIIGVRFRT